MVLSKIWGDRGGRIYASESIEDSPKGAERLGSDLAIVSSEDGKRGICKTEKQGKGTEGRKEILFRKYR